MKQNGKSFLAGLLAGALAFGGGTAMAAGITAEPSTNPIYADGRQVQMTAYRIGGSNYVRLRDIGKAVGFNVYWQDGVQVDSKTPYTGEAPALVELLHLSSYKGNTLNAGERSMLMISPYGTACTARSSAPSVADLELVSGKWVIVAKFAGTAVISATDDGGRTASLTIAVTGEAPAEPEPDSNSGIDLNANMEIRQEMIRLINEVRRQNGVPELVVNDALMNAAQDTSAHKFTRHTDYEAKAAKAYGYPYGSSTNLTWFNRDAESDVAERAVSNWVNSPFHFQTMTAERFDTLGVGITVENDIAYCFLFVGNPNGHNAYE